MNLTGQITWVGPVQSGTSQRGNQWSKQDFVLQYENGQYPKSVCLSAFNDEKYVGKLRVGINVSVDFDITTRDWTDKNGQLHKMNDFNIWRDGIHSVQPQGQAQQPAAQAAPPQQQQAPAAPAVGSQPANTGEPELPF